ncbi:uncharacterized protein LOC116246981 [Nymphaea colorata]|nr:uncharacterized protein LOC116246981 [Nymphaea colorata]
MKAFRVAEANLCVYLHPSASKNIMQAVRQQLSSLILKYDDRFDGVVLAHYDTKIQNKTARLMSSLTPYFGVRLRTKLLLFSPKPGMLLAGKVTTIGLDFVRVIVLGISVATISFDDIREEFSYLENGDERMLRSTLHRRHVIQIGTILHFVAKSVEETTGDIMGSLMPHDTGSVQWLYSHKARKRDKLSSKLESQEQDLQMKNSTTPRKTHKSKRRRMHEDLRP